MSDDRDWYDNMTVDWGLVHDLFVTGLIATLILGFSLALLGGIVGFTIKHIRKYHADHGLWTTVTAACGWTFAFVVFIFLMISVGIGVRVFLM